ncbi:MAG: hypothetical protein B7733_11095 [Myxococcales bacterium FL481]|nr:MAG: hypothetical protein B7733_11095 [Myxococcales bacterium FL481]
MHRGWIIRVGLTGGLVCGCNPLVYEQLLEDAWVQDDAFDPPTRSNVHGSVAATFPPGEPGPSSVLMAGDHDGMMVWWGLHPDGTLNAQYPRFEEANALVNPIQDIRSTRVRGLVRVPAPTRGDSTAVALAAFVSPGEPEKSRIVGIALPTFVRIDPDPSRDVLNPTVRGSPVPGFGRGLAAINLDADPDDLVEVMVGSEIGVLIFDSLDRNRPTYAANKADLPPEAITGANEPAGYSFTLCENPEITGIASGDLLGDEPAFVVADPGGLTLMGTAAEDPVNAVGAPVFACDLARIAAPEDATDTFGQALYVDDINADGATDLVVGDPGGNAVYVYVANASGLPDEPASITPSESARAFGASIGRADLGGTHDPALVIGAPDSDVDGVPRVGKVFLYDLPGYQERTVLADLTPEPGSRYGRWAGGVGIDGDRDELVVVGTRGLRVHVAIDAGDPHPSGAEVD